MAERRGWRPGPPVTWVYRAGQVFGQTVMFPPLFRVRLLGAAQVPATGAGILVSNHFSRFDPIVMGAYVPRFVTFAAKRELVNAPVLGALIRLWGVVPLTRDGMDMPAVRQLLRVLRSGHLVVMYPEGTRSKDGVLHRPRPGAAYLALKVGVPVYPVSIWGPERLSIQRRLRRGRLPVTISIGQPLTFEPRRGRIAPAELEDAGETIMRAIAAGLPERCRGPYA